jgi:hypothetical protein
MSRVGLEARDLIHDDGRRLCPPPQRVNELTGGQSLESNIALVCSNAEARSDVGRGRASLLTGAEAWQAKLVRGIGCL